MFVNIIMFFVPPPLRSLRIHSMNSATCKHTPYWLIMVGTLNDWGLCIMHSAHKAETQRQLKITKSIKNIQTLFCPLAVYSPWNKKINSLNAGFPPLLWQAVRQINSRSAPPPSRAFFMLLDHLHSIHPSLTLCLSNCIFNCLSNFNWSLETLCWSSFLNNKWTVKLLWCVSFCGIVLPSGSKVWKTLLACSDGDSGATRDISCRVRRVGGRRKKEKEAC